MDEVMVKFGCRRADGEGDKGLPSEERLRRFEFSGLVRVASVVPLLMDG